MIPDAAAEAAARAHYDASAVAATRPWNSLAPMVRRIRLTKMRAALEAAAPYLENPAHRAGFLLAEDFYKEQKDTALPSRDTPPQN